MAAPPDDPASKPHRFYQQASVADWSEDRDGFGVALDGRLVKTPEGARLIVPTRRLAELLAEEWSAQGEVIDAQTMPMSRLAFTALDRGAETHAKLAEQVARYANSDLLCYFADHPASLLEREVAHWAPLLSWAEQELGLDLIRATGVAPISQPPETLERARRLAAELQVFELIGLLYAAGLFGSAVLAFAVQRGMLGGTAAFDLARLDEAYQEERWGVDAEAEDRTQRLRDEAELVERWFRALRA